jgi:O-antigen chain-terminating methyltransferase
LLNAFNESITNLENIINSRIDQLRPEIDDKINQLRPEIDDKINQLRPEIDDKINQLRPEIDDKINQLRPEIDRKIVNEVNSLFSSMSSDIENKAWLAKVLESRSSSDLEGNNSSVHPFNPDTGVNYFVFEDRFRGPRETIMQKQNDFLRYFEGCKNVLDIGCGRGEFLETMRNNGIGAHGVDLDETMVDYCRSKGLEVEYGDALDYIQQLEDSSIDGIFIDQVIEHLEPSYLVKLLKLCFQKMKYGYYIVAETVNPLSFSSFANFYIDLTHIKPVHPETLKFILESTGFRELEVMFSSPLPEEAQLKKIAIHEEMSDAEKCQIEVYNWNIERLNATLYGAQDYALIGKK